MNKLILCLIMIMALTSCSKKISLFNPNPNKLNINNLDYEYVSLRSKIKYADESTKQRVVATIRLKKDSILWFSVTPGLGIEAARGVITKDEFIILDRLHKTYTRRPIREFSEKAHFDLIFSSLVIQSVMHKSNFKIKKSPPPQPANRVVF